MKKFLICLASVLVLFACFVVSACDDKEPVKADENTVIITVSNSSFDFEGKKLIDYMDYLQDSKELTYTVANGMVTSINGKSNTTNSFWMLYTSDTENSNNAWGTFEHEGALYGSATLGAEALVLKEGCIYVWAYQTF